jgi:hypothetical protein
MLTMDITLDHSTIRALLALVKRVFGRAVKDDAGCQQSPSEQSRNAPIMEPVPADHVHFITLHWTEDRPYLQYRSDRRAAQTEQMELPVGHPITLELVSGRICIGYYDFVRKERLPCPDQRRLSPRYLQCFHCQRQEVTYYAFTGIAADPVVAQAYLDTQPHQAYLSLFGADLLKVGVAAIGRRLRRTIEQGALACVFFAQANGSQIRELERFVWRQLHVKDRITLLQKARRLAMVPDPDQAQSTLFALVQQIEQALPPDLRQWLLPQPEFHYLQDTYRLKLDPMIAEARFVKQAEVGDRYSGRVLGVVGNLLVLESLDKQTYLLPAKHLQGYQLEVIAGLRQPHLKHSPQVIRFDRQ